MWTARRTDHAARSVTIPAMSLQRIAWIVTVAALLVGALIMLLSNYQGYAALFAAVALSAAINLR